MNFNQILISSFLLILSLFFCVLSIFGILYLLRGVSVLDNGLESTRKIHTGKISRLGGVGIVSSFLLVSLFYLLYFKYYESNEYLSIQWLQINVFSCLAIGLLGLWDDIGSVSARFRLLVELILACLVCFFGLLINSVYIPFVGLIDLGYLAYPVTILWIIGLINSLNLIDGADGLSSGISLIAASFLGFIAIFQADFILAGLLCIFIGSVLGFWFFNKYPAKIFMGDSGSCFLGAFLALASIRIIQITPNKPIEFAVFMLLLLPILDTTIAFVRRILKGQPFFIADGKHLHHRLLYFGFSHLKTVRILYLYSFGFGVCGFSLYYIPEKFSLFILLFVSGLLGGLFYQTKYIETLQEFFTSLQYNYNMRHINQQLVSSFKEIEQRGKYINNVEDLSKVIDEMITLSAADYGMLIIYNNDSKEPFIKQWQSAPLDNSKYKHFSVGGERHSKAKLTLYWQKPVNIYSVLLPIIEKTCLNIGKSFKSL